MKETKSTTQTNQTNQKKILNLTWHDIIFLNENQEETGRIPHSWILRLEIDFKEVKDENIPFPLKEREEKEITFENISEEEIKQAYAIIVSAQAVEWAKKRFPNVKVLSVWKTVYEILPD